MKIGILTFHSAHNYGAILQAYGLQEYLKSQGYDTYMVDFQPDYVINSTKRDGMRMWLSRNPKMCVLRLINYIRYRNIRHARWDGFEEFIKNRFHLFPYKEDEDFHSFDAILIGSDQVWSPYHTGGWYQDIMFGVGFKCKSISYAPSCSMDSLTEEQAGYLRRHSDGMTAISTRERKFKDLLQPLTHKEISVVVDPTILAGRNVFEKIAAPIGRTCPYVWVYEIKQHDNVYRIATDLAKQLNADVVELTNGMLGYHRKTMKEGASPEEFLGYFKNALCVVTTSFHGTVFSVLFNRPFYMVKQNSPVDIRMTFLLEQLHLEERLIEMGDQVIFSKPDFTYTDKYLAELRKSSEEFIKDALEE